VKSSLIRVNPSKSDWNFFLPIWLKYVKQAIFAGNSAAGCEREPVVYLGPDQLPLKRFRQPLRLD